MQFDFTFEGNVADVPEVRITPSGKTLARMRVGHNTRRRNTRGEWVNGSTIWFTVTAWEALAENIAESISRGDTVIVTCRDDLSVFAYTNQSTGKPVGELQVTASNVALSMRFHGAESHRKPRQDVYADPWATATSYDNAYAEVVAEAAAEARAAAGADRVQQAVAAGQASTETADADLGEPAEVIGSSDLDETAEPINLDAELAAAAMAG
ncbi:single-stranded DNA-binding protein [Actinoplanes regularis]|uniref:Single stranded DNA-binding protein (Ssb) n=1 Tax=Actinoplanes regularis TaxID=52697 RepID=A0A238XJ16_9ACTN|nr:single-stranded DNA-binding protein [Actinoplanes regularis]GIE90486.1 hypothetical protein Are01nite_69660 [Actinoplanes regularis]SNR58571.1 single stranded DNA-binding protein (ssb) [Actinoplanes regularis]